MCNRSFRSLVKGGNKEKEDCYEEAGTGSIFPDAGGAGCPERLFGGPSKDQHAGCDPTQYYILKLDLDAANASKRPRADFHYSTCDDYFETTGTYYHGSFDVIHHYLFPPAFVDNHLDNHVDYPSHHDSRTNYYCYRASYVYTHNDEHLSASGNHNPASSHVHKSAYDDRYHDGTIPVSP